MPSEPIDSGQAQTKAAEHNSALACLQAAIRLARQCAGDQEVAQILRQQLREMGRHLVVCDPIDRAG